MVKLRGSTIEFTFSVVGKPVVDGDPAEKNPVAEEQVGDCPVGVVLLGSTEEVTYTPG
jgi:hypothetical protein